MKSIEQNPVNTADQRDKKNQAAAGEEGRKCLGIIDTQRTHTRDRFLPCALIGNRVVVIRSASSLVSLRLTSPRLTSLDNGAFANADFNADCFEGRDPDGPRTMDEGER